MEDGKTRLGVAADGARTLPLTRDAEISILVHGKPCARVCQRQPKWTVITGSAKRLFFGLIALQACHSTEEYVFGLYDVFPPAMFVSGLVASDRQVGFAVLNVLLVLFGIWCCVWPVRREWPVAVTLMWGWVVVETCNGIVHPAWSIVQRSYTPGVVTSVLFLPVTFLLARELSTRTQSDGLHPHNDLSHTAP